MKRKRVSVVALVACFGLSARSGEDMPTNETVDQLLEAETEKRTVRLAKNEPTDRSEQLLVRFEQDERKEASQQQLLDRLKEDEPADERRVRVIRWQAGETERKVLRTLCDSDDVTGHYEDQQWSNASKRPLYE